MTEEPLTNFDPLMWPGALIRRAQQVHTQVWVDVVGSDLTSPQFAVLIAVYGEPDLDQTRLSQSASLDTSTCQDIVRRLLERGLIERSRDARDGRRWSVRLSAAGRAAVDAAMPGVMRVGERLLEPLDEAERRAFTLLLRKVVRHGEAH
jgi:DNA-binding MarR family transcriptional regulator